MGRYMLTGLQRWFDGVVERKLVQFSGRFAEYFGAPASSSGEPVSTESALRVTAFLRGCLVIADGLAQLPVVLHRRVAGGVEPAIDHPLHDLLAYQPNSQMDPTEWVRITVFHAAATGQAVSWRNVLGGQLRELWPIRPEYLSVDVRQDLELQFRLQFENSATALGTRADVFHLRGPSWDGFEGLDPVHVGRDALGLAQATERSQAGLHKNGVKTTGLFTIEGRPTEEQRAGIREAIRSLYAGGENAGRPVLATSALKFQPVTMTGVDAQHLDTRKHQIEEIARLLGVFPVMLGHAGDQSPTFASAEAFFAAHVRYTLQPWIKAFLAALNSQLLTIDERRAGLEFRMDTSELTRGSLADRTAYYQAALGSTGGPGWLTPDEVREDDGWNPRGFDRVFAPTGMAPLGDGGVPEAPAAAPGPQDTMPAAVGG